MFATTLPHNENQDEWSLNQFNEEMMDAWYELCVIRDFFPIMIQGTSMEDCSILRCPIRTVHENKDTVWSFWTEDGTSSMVVRREMLCIHLSNMRESHKQYCVDYGDYLSRSFYLGENCSRFHEKSATFSWRPQ